LREWAGMAERKGFEPLRRFPAYTLSRRAPSTTRPPLRIACRPGWKGRTRGSRGAAASEAQYTHERRGRKGSLRLEERLFFPPFHPSYARSALLLLEWGGRGTRGLCLARNEPGPVRLEQVKHRECGCGCCYEYW